MTAGCETSGNPRVLVFCRPYLVADFRAMVAPLEARFNFHFLTDGRCAGTQDTREIFYASLQARCRSPEIDPDLENDIVIRCRMLRRLDRETAGDLVHAMAISLGAHLDRERPDTIFSQLTDEYVTHLLALLAARRGINTTQICYAYFPDRMQFFDFSYGVAREGLSSPAPSEVRAVLEKLKEIEHRQDYHLRAAYSFPRHLKLVLRYFVKKLVFATYGFFERDPWYVHYAIIPYVAERRRIADFPPGGLFQSDWESALDRAKRAGKLIVYMPLGFHPESSTDYWIADRRFARYIETIITVIQSFSSRDDVCFAVKEHVHMLGMRGNGVYRALKALPNVISIPPLVYSNRVLQRSDCVLVGTGSVGIEAMVHDTPVFSFSDTCYWFESSGAHYLDLDDLAAWPEIIETVVRTRRPKSEDEKLAALRRMLSSTAPNLRKGRVWPIVTPDALEAALTQALSQSSPGTLFHAPRSAPAHCRAARNEPLSGASVFAVSDDFNKRRATQ
jgi:hypothetical protein